MFKLPHLLVLAFTFVSVPLFARWLKKQPDQRIHRFFQACGVLVLAFDPSYWLWEVNRNGVVDVSQTLPLYICSLFWMMLPFAVYLKPSIFKRIALANVCTVGIAGGLMGLVFNTYVGLYPFFSFIPIRSLIYHVFMLLVAVSMWVTGYYKPKAGDEYLCMIPVVIMLIPAIILNKLFGWDYFYTAGGPGTPFELVSSIIPIPVFLMILYGLLAFIIRETFYRKTKVKLKDVAIKIKTTAEHIKH